MVDILSGVLRLTLLLVVALAAQGFAADTIRSIRAPKDVKVTADPNALFWKGIPGVTAANDPHGRPVPGMETEIRSRWTPRYLYLLFVCPYNELSLKPDPRTDVETNHLWNWDTAEAFIGSDFKHINLYKEFEVSPQGEWVDLDIDSTNMSNQNAWKWNSGFQVAARVDAAAHVWYGAMKIPYHALDARKPRPGLKLRANFYRLQGPAAHRAFLSWQPTGKDSYHVPESFGTLELAH